MTVAGYDGIFKGNAPAKKYMGTGYCADGTYSSKKEYNSVSELRFCQDACSDWPECHTVRVCDGVLTLWLMMLCSCGTTTMSASSTTTVRTTIPQRLLGVMESDTPRKLILAHVSALKTETHLISKY